MLEISGSVRAKTISDESSSIQILFRRHELRSLVIIDAWVIIDAFHGQTRNAACELVEENHISEVLDLSSCMDKLQPSDLAVNNAAKDQLRQKFYKWYPGRSN